MRTNPRQNSALYSLALLGSLVLLFQNCGQPGFQINEGMFLSLSESGQTEIHGSPTPSPTGSPNPSVSPTSQPTVTPTPTITATPTPFEKTFYPGDYPEMHQLGQRKDLKEWDVHVSQTNEKYLTFGPYTTAVPDGQAVAIFSLALDNVSADNLKIITLDVFDSTTGTTLSRRELKRMDFSTPFQAQEFELNFVATAQHALEFRVFYHNYAYVRHYKTTIRNITSLSFQSDPLGALWQGRGQFKFLRTIPLPGNECCGWFAVKDGAWYFFSREVNYDAALVQACGRRDVARTVVRVSFDQGATWSEKQVVASPVAGNTLMNCAVLDGSTYLDSSNGTWHLLTQCLGTQGGWSLCHFTRNDPSPMGPFTPAPQNPVIIGGQLWRQICEGEGKSCPTSVIDEGTPEILFRKNGYFYVSFHGFDPGPRSGYRGMVRTLDFRTWEVSGGDLPGDALFGPRDCQFWNPGCIGGGAASHVSSGGYNYMIIETPDVSLGCAPSQYWVFGLVRSRSLVKSGQWERFSQNPLLKPSMRRACGLQYARFIEDQGVIFLIYEDAEKGRRLFQLVSGMGAPLLE